MSGLKYEAGEYLGNMDHGKPEKKSKMGNYAGVVLFFAVCEITREKKHLK